MTVFSAFVVSLRGVRVGGGGEGGGGFGGRRGF